jgi:hypothetical protein
MFLIAPTNGTALSVQSSVPQNSPFRRIASPIVTTASAVPIHGTDRASRRVTRPPP